MFLKNYTIEKFKLFFIQQMNELGYINIINGKIKLSVIYDKNNECYTTTLKFGESLLYREKSNDYVEVIGKNIDGLYMELMKLHKSIETIFKQLDGIAINDVTISNTFFIRVAKNPTIKPKSKFYIETMGINDNYLSNYGCEIHDSLSEKLISGLWAKFSNAFFKPFQPTTENIKSCDDNGIYEPFELAHLDYGSQSVKLVEIVKWTKNNTLVTIRNIETNKTYVVLAKRISKIDDNHSQKIK